MSVWVVCPSARPVAEVAAWAAAWRERGYKVAVWRDVHGPDASVGADIDMTWAQEYPGYAKSVNMLVATVILRDLLAEWLVIAGDDVFPDPNYTAHEIARECRDYFALRTEPHPMENYPTFGVMQPTGDRWGDSAGAYIDRVAGSAWFGREYCKRVNQGNGPLWPEYHHMYVDQEAREIAVKLGVYWERPDLTQHHAHWGRPREGERIGLASRMPEFLRKANEEMGTYRRLFEKRKALGFPGSECL
jgi:hypothetical protein